MHTSLTCGPLIGLCDCHHHPFQNTLITHEKPGTISSHPPFLRSSPPASGSTHLTCLSRLASQDIPVVPSGGCNELCSQGRVQTEAPYCSSSDGRRPRHSPSASVKAICVQANFRPLPKEVKNKNDNKKTPNPSEWAGPGTEQPPKTPPPWYYIRGMTLGETQLSDHSMPCRWRHTICGLLFTNDSSFLGHKKILIRKVLT